jgi:hypothetical protein
VVENRTRAKGQQQWQQQGKFQQWGRASRWHRRYLCERKRA